MSHITPDQIHAYVDGELAAEDARRVAEALRSDPEAAAQAEDYRLINTLLQDAVEEAASGPVPRRHFDAVRGGRWAWGRMAVAASVLLAVGGLGGWLAHGALNPPADVLDRLALASSDVWLTYAPDAKRPVELAAADSGELATWLSSRIGQSVPIPNLGELGFSFIGGRLLASDGGPAAMLMYEAAGGKRLVVYVSPSLSGTGPTGMHYREKAGWGAMVWANGRTGFAVSGPFEEDQLMPAALVVRTRFTP